MGENTKPYTFRLPEEMIDAVQAVADQESIAASAIIRQAIKAFLKEKYKIEVDAAMQHGGYRERKRQP